MEEYGNAKEKYKKIGVDTESALELLGEHTGLDTLLAA